MKRYENKRNVIGKLIKEKRKVKGLSKSDVCRKLQLHAVYLDLTELNRMEEERMIIKDFELISLCKVLDISYEDLKNVVE